MTQTTRRAPKLRTVSLKYFGFIGIIVRPGGSLPKNDTESYLIPA